MSTPPTSALIRTVPSSWSLTCPLQTWAVIVKLTRKDGLTLGFTTHDADLLIGDGIIYEALSSVQASNLRQELGQGPENMEIVGILQSERIADTDLLAGLYDGARLKIGVVDWTAPGGVLILAAGYLGEVTVEEGAYRVEYRSLMQRLQQQIGILTSPTCRVKQLGDTQCTVNLAGNTAQGDPITSNTTIASVIDTFTLTLAGGVNKAGFYNNGQITFTSGLNTGLSREINFQGNGATGVDTAGPISSSPGSFGSIGFSNNNNQVTTTFTFAIPAGMWASAYVTINSTWTAHNPDNLGTDDLIVYIPTTQGSLVRQGATPGSFSDVFDVGNLSLLAIDQAAGGTLNCGFQHASPGSGGYFNIAVTSCTLTLEGVAAGTSNRIVLQEEFPYAVVPGDAVTVIAGCDRLYQTCILKFNNIINNRSEPTIPGIDRLAQVGRHNS
jgi:uncharacterized phage protein (TIGR02218 family)